LEEAREADVLLHVIDASHPDWEEQRAVVREVLGELGLESAERIMVFNKIDRLTHAEEEALRERVRALGRHPSVFVSALHLETLGSLRETLKARIQARLDRVVIHLQVGDGQTLASLYREGEVLSRRDVDGVVLVEARIPPALRAKLAARAETRVEEAS
jgi:GTP-binding protein HflX